MKFQFKTLKRDHTFPRWRSLILYIWLLALILRISHLFLSAENPLLYMPVLDEKYYVDLGKIIAGGQWTGENKVFFMDPLYGYFLSGIFFFFGDNLTTVRLIQIALDAFNVVLIYHIGSRIWNREAGCVAALSYAVYPVSFFYSLLILKATLTISMLLFFTLFLIYTLEKKGSLCWYTLGLFAALMTYLRGNMILLIPLVILFIPIYQGLEWSSFAKKSLLLVLGFITLLSVGVFRNFMVSGEFAVLNSQAGRLLYSCNNPRNLTGRYNVPSFARPNPVESEIDFHKEAEHRKGMPLDSGEVSSYWTMETLRFFLKNPVIIPRLLYNKIKGTVGNCEIANNHSFDVASLFSPLLKWPPVPFAFAFALGLPGLVLGIKRNKKVAVLLIPLLTVLVTILIFYTSSRFRMPAVPFLLIGGGITFSILQDWMREKKIVKVCALALVVGICGFLSLSIACPKPSGTETFLLAKAYWHQHDFKNATRYALKGVHDFPRQARFHVLLGMIAFSNNQPDDAKIHNEQAIRLDPGNVDAFHNMGLIYLETKRPEQAIGWFQKAIILAERPGTFFYTAKAYEEAGLFSPARKNYDKFLRTSEVSNPLRWIAIHQLENLNRLQRHYGKE